MRPLGFVSKNASCRSRCANSGKGVGGCLFSIIGRSKDTFSSILNALARSLLLALLVLILEASRSRECLHIVSGDTSHCRVAANTLFISEFLMHNSTLGSLASSNSILLASAISDVGEYDSPFNSLSFIHFWMTFLVSGVVKLYTACSAYLRFNPKLAPGGQSWIALRHIASSWLIHWRLKFARSSS